MFSTVHCTETEQNVASASPPLDEVLLRLAARSGGTNLEKRVTELEKALICQRIKEARQKAGLTQEELADLLHVRVRTLANYESNRVPFRLLGQIAEFTGVTQEWLLTGQDPDRPPVDAQELESLRAEIGDVREQLGRIETLVRQLAELPAQRARA